MKTIVTIIVGMAVLFPCLLIFNESDTILPNLAGLLYCVVLYMSRHTNVGKWAINKVMEANKNIERWMN